MQKKLIALALAGMVAAPAIAQSNVTVYGIIDTFIGYGNAGDTKFSGLSNGMLNGPRIGFKGTEDLGNGLKAKFVLEQGFSSDDGEPNSSKQFHRQAWAGLEGGFGLVGLGRQYAPGYYSYRNDPMQAGPMDPRAIVIGGSTNALGATSSRALQIQSGSRQRWDNSINYQSPNWSGFSAQVIYAFGSTEQETDVAGAFIDKEDDNQLGVGLNYANGPLNVDYVYVNSGAVATSATPAGRALDIDEHYLGGTYDFGMVALSASYQVANVEDVVGTGDDNVNVWQVGVIVPVGMGNVHFAYAARDDDADEANSKSYGLMYTHNLSKRTIAYVAANRTTNDDNVGRGALVGEAGESANAFGLGIRHAF